MRTHVTHATTDMIDSFREDGFVMIPDVFTADEVERFGRAVDAAVAHYKANERRALAERSRYEQSFLQCLNLWTAYDDVLPWTCHPRLAGIAASLLGADAVRVWHDQALYKEPGARRTDPHQDHPYWPIRETDQVTAWIPFDGSTLAGGAMAYHPGSHRRGLDRYIDIFGDDDPDDIGDDPALLGTDPVYVEVPPGGVAFHHGLTAHFAAPNSTPATRRVHTVIYTADGVHRSTDRFHPAVDFDGIGVGEQIDGSITPIVWPRASGDLPTAPPGVGQYMEEIKRRYRRD